MKEKKSCWVLKQIQEISMETCFKKKKKQKQYVRNSYKNMKKMQNKKLVFAQYKNEWKHTKIW